MGGFPSHLAPPPSQSLLHLHVCIVTFLNLSSFKGQVSEDTKKKASSDVNGSETTSGVLRPSPLQESSEYSSQSSNVSSTANPIVANV